MTAEDIEALVDFLKRSRGFDFTGYKRASLARRFEKRMQFIGVEGYDEYIDYLQVHPDEFTELFNVILINVTAFFRDEPIWSFLASDVIPQLIKSKEPETSIRVWSAGCASGEEAYSIAMLLEEALGSEEFLRRVKIYGTDVDEEALAQARTGTFSDKSVNAMPPRMRDKYFKKQSSGWTFSKALRRALIFGRHDLVQDAPISRVDLLLCRNVLMYLNSETQSKVMTRLHFALNDGGSIVLGKAEMLFTRFRYFTPVDLRNRVFTKESKDLPNDALFMLAQAGNQDAVGELTSHLQGREAAFEAGPVSQLVVDKRGNLALANEKARQEFSLRQEDLGRPLRDLEVSFRPVALVAPIEEVVRTRRPWSVSSVVTPGSQGDTHSDVDIVPLLDPSGSLLGVSITFRDITRYQELQQELEHANQELETAMEELQSTNEELETTNEELQSTNEELETMNEELQSTNEELQTLNEEMNRKSGALHDVNAFLESVLSSVKAAVIAIDETSNVTAWNNIAQELWGLRADEVRGRSLYALDIGLKVDGLRTMIRSSLEGGSELEDTMVDAINRRGRSIRCRVRSAPLRRSSGEVQGAILFIETDGSPGEGP